jgi:hypothetical protein
MSTLKTMIQIDLVTLPPSFIVITVILLSGPIPAMLMFVESGRHQVIQRNLILAHGKSLRVALGKVYPR